MWRGEETGDGASKRCQSEEARYDKKLISLLKLFRISK